MKIFVLPEQDYAVAAPSYLKVIPVQGPLRVRIVRNKVDPGKIVGRCIE